MQALQLMNDVQHFEAARNLAERTISEGGETVGSRINFLYRTVVSRLPNADELRLVETAYASQKALFDGDKEAALKALKVGESLPADIAPPAEFATWTMIANLVLNLDETVTRN
jgi:hypothetical protein